MKNFYRYSCATAAAALLIPSISFSFPVVSGQQANFRQGQTDWLTGFADPASSTFFGARPVAADTLFGPNDVLYSPTNQWMIVADTLNRRVLIFDAAGGSSFNGTPLFVLGQPNSTTGGADPSNPFGHSNTANASEGCAAGVNACGLRRPFSLAYDDGANPRLFVADPDNRRVLVWDLTTPRDGMAASWVLGQNTFTSDTHNQACGGGGAGAPSACGMSFPSSVAFDDDSQRLFVADSANNRVMVFDTSSLSNGMPATWVLGQQNLVSNQRNLACSGPSGAASACGFDWAGAVAWDAGANTLFVGDFNNHRVLAFDLGTGITPAMPADLVLGQPDFVTSTANTACGGGASGPANVNACGLGIWGTTLETSSDQLFVNDIANHRVLSFDTATLSNGTPASAVIGHNDFTSGYNAASSSYGGGTDRSSLVNPTGMAIDEQTDRLFVADLGNHRIMVFGSNVAGTAVETTGDLASSVTTENPNGSVTIDMENSQGQELAITFPPGTTGQNGGGIEILSGYYGGNPNQPGVVINAELPAGATKEVTLPLLGNTVLCVIDQETTWLASCNAWFRFTVPAAGACANRNVIGDLGDNPSNPNDPFGIHRVRVCTSANGQFVTVSGLLHSFVAAFEGSAGPEIDPDGFDPDSAEIAKANGGGEGLTATADHGGGCTVHSQTSGAPACLALALWLAFGYRKRRRHS